ncbi:MAG: molybdopterin-dependent oxidoreductase [Burkholderiales bacterium]|nr:molybdopterin-dependent oxidoreductase [Burkholderiales bacterium]
MLPIPSASGNRGLSPLPPGQREAGRFHRFGLWPYASRFPRHVATPSLDVVGAVERPLQLRDALSGLPRHEIRCDFHCVTTWSVRNLRWGGVRFVDFFEHVVQPQAAPAATSTVVALRGQDGARTGMHLSDLLAPDVLLADTLDGAPLGIDHGAPLRLVAPAHYGYKWAKHLSRIEFLPADTLYRVAGWRFMDHPRARVALEERGRVVPGWLLRYLYRPLINPTAAHFARSHRRYQQR